MTTFDLRIAEPMLTVPEVASALGAYYDSTDVWALVATGELHPVNVISWRGTKTRIRQLEVETYLRRRAQLTRDRLGRGARPARVRISFANHRGAA